MIGRLEDRQGNRKRFHDAAGVVVTDTLPTEATFEAINPPHSIALVETIRRTPHIVTMAAQALGPGHRSPLQEVIGHKLTILSG